MHWRFRAPVHLLILYVPVLRLPLRFSACFFLRLSVRRSSVFMFLLNACLFAFQSLVFCLPPFFLFLLRLFLALLTRRQSDLRWLLQEGSSAQQCRNATLLRLLQLLQQTRDTDIKWGNSMLALQVFFSYCRRWRNSVVLVRVAAAPCHHFPVDELPHHTCHCHCCLLCCCFCDCCCLCCSIVYLCGRYWSLSNICFFLLYLLAIP